jgi:hypothetical protein
MNDTPHLETTFLLVIATAKVLVTQAIKTSNFSIINAIISTFSSDVDQNPSPPTITTDTKSTKQNLKVSLVFTTTSQ